MSFQGYAGNARDSKRSEDLAMLASTFAAAAAASSAAYPDPQGAFAATWSGATAWKQGTFGKAALDVVRGLAKGGLSAVPLDPSSGEPYGYAVDGAGRQYQFLAFAEKPVAFSPLAETAYAAPADGTALLKGNYNGLYAVAATGASRLPLSAPTLFLSASAASGASVDAGNPAAHSGFLLPGLGTADAAAYAPRQLAASVPVTGYAKSALVRAVAAAYSGAGVPASVAALPAVLSFRAAAASASGSAKSEAYVLDGAIGTSTAVAMRENTDLAGPPPPPPPPPSAYSSSATYAANDRFAFLTPGAVTATVKVTTGGSVASTYVVGEVESYSDGSAANANGCSAPDIVIAK